MARPIDKVLLSYRAGRYDDALAALLPMLKKASTPVLEMMLLAAQCYSKTKQNAEAAKWYLKASEVPGPKQAMLRALAAELLQQLDESLAALTAARQAAKSVEFDREAEASFRRCLHKSLCLDETLMENQRFLDLLRAGDERYFSVEQPFNNISWCADESLNARMTYVHNASAYTADTKQARRTFPHAFDNKIRIGYLSSDFSDQHATMRLFQSVIFGHDRQRFDVTLFCNTNEEMIRNDRGLRQTYPNLVQIGHLSDMAAAQLIRSRGIDILVDLKGHTKGARIGVINIGGAPIQVAYLGYPGSGTGIDCDYVIGDRIVLPTESRPFYHEKFCLLPDSYQANDNIHRPRPQAATRAALGLPEDRPILAAFNVTRKITPQTASLWAEILRRTPASLLWILCSDRFARDNFLKWISEEGIARERVIFADRADYAEHIARLPAADIGLDTFPYNGHTTTSDQLWAGLPVPTYKGSHFASRVTESLLNAAGIPELVAADPRSYVELCVSLIEDAPRLRAVREKLRAGRDTCPLFDTTRFTRHLEQAFEIMVERERAGLAPDHFAVSPLPVR
ncbi:hypothetical protein HGO38_08470 [Rhizobium sp. CG5]|uniref:O-linked N-acetylglucosamine transferase, SPINDLY family protein n=1 Tax=Rhizobium sp. CG5 TaxID=2726076 RepID=UPI00203345E7|nr:hypothetical protein [Rhizobium sp. CG5]MCM2473511.1 hypothetical protein [Rhizobium sp. CG5]